MSSGNYFDLKKKVYSNIMARKKVEISSNTDLKKVKTTLYNMIRTSKKIDGRSFQKYINQVAAIKNKESNRRKLMDLYDVIVAIDKSETKSTYQKVAEV
jgi:nitrogen regulatory protein PII